LGNRFEGKISGMRRMREMKEKKLAIASIPNPPSPVTNPLLIPEFLTVRSLIPLN
jgi:hypothetical protein